MFIEAKDDGGGGDNWTIGDISRAKLQSNHHHQQTNIQFFAQFTQANLSAGKLDLQISPTEILSVDKVDLTKYFLSADMSINKSRL